MHRAERLQQSYQAESLSYANSPSYLVQKFSLRDAKYRFFLRRKLTDQSSDLATLWAPFDGYKRKQMLLTITCSPEEFQRQLSEPLKRVDGAAVVADDIAYLSMEKEQHKTRAVIEGKLETEQRFPPTELPYYWPCHHSRWGKARSFQH